MEWRDDGIVLAARRQGEGGLVVSLLTRAHGRHAGWVPGGGSTKARGVYQPGNRVTARWRARLEEHLGTYGCEPAASTAAGLMDDPARLAALASACALIEAALPERAPHPALYEATVALLDALPRPGWGRAYVLWELTLLAELGFGLDLGACAATGAKEGLAYVSPRTGRAVSRSAGRPWHDRLLPLPGFLVTTDDGNETEVLAGLRLTGHFLARHVFGERERGLPAARQRLADRLHRAAAAAQRRPCGVG
jgi:DNA repair protein RecO (recombination protein O)